jgi:hypothetical protein
MLDQPQIGPVRGRQGKIASSAKPGYSAVDAVRLFPTISQNVSVRKRSKMLDSVLIFHRACLGAHQNKLVAENYSIRGSIKKKRPRLWDRGLPCYGRRSDGTGGILCKGDLLSKDCANRRVARNVLRTAIWTASVQKSPDRQMLRASAAGARVSVATPQHRIRPHCPSASMVDDG